VKSLLYRAREAFRRLYSREAGEAPARARPVPV
jgi:hypothetical protein